MRGPNQHQEESHAHCFHLVQPCDPLANQPTTAARKDSSGRLGGLLTEDVQTLCIAGDGIAQVPWKWLERSPEALEVTRFSTQKASNWMIWLKSTRIIRELVVGRPVALPLRND